MRKYLFITLCATMLNACYSINAISKLTEKKVDSYDPTIHARIRLYGQNNKPTEMWHNLDCDKKGREKKVSVGGNFKEALGSAFGTVKNSSIGMPVSEISKQMDSKSAFFSKVFFQEFAVVANKPVAVRSSFLRHDNEQQMSGYKVVHKTGHSCHGKLAYFTPKVGHDYEVVSTEGTTCGIQIYEIEYRTGAVTPIAIQDHASCGK